MNYNRMTARPPEQWKDAPSGSRKWEAWRAYDRFSRYVYGLDGNGEVIPSTATDLVDSVIYRMVRAYQEEGERDG